MKMSKFQKGIVVNIFLFRIADWLEGSWNP